MEYNVYCDESCHLEHDGKKAMVLGAIWCPSASAKEKFTAVRAIKAQHELTGKEAKWGKISPKNRELYESIIDYFFNDKELRFRAIVIADKARLDHSRFVGQDHDTWYYKMYFHLLNGILSAEHSFRIYLDIKDTLGSTKVKKLHEVLCNANYDFSRSIVRDIQVVRSQEVELVQVCDVLIGALSYRHRLLTGSSAKLSLIDRVRRRSGFTLDSSTLLREEKFNLFFWNPS